MVSEISLISLNTLRLLWYRPNLAPWAWLQCHQTPVCDQIISSLVEAFILACLHSDIIGIFSQPLHICQILFKLPVVIKAEFVARKILNIRQELEPAPETIDSSLKISMVFVHLAKALAFFFARQALKSWESLCLELIDYFLMALISKENVFCVMINHSLFAFVTRFQIMVLVSNPYWKVMLFGVSKHLFDHSRRLSQVPDTIWSPHHVSNG